LEIARRGYDRIVSEFSPEFEQLVGTLKKAAAALKREKVPFMLGGSLAYWVRGASEPPRDLDLMLRPEDAERALTILAAEGMRPERPPEGWLVKAWDGPVLLDLIFAPAGVPMDASTLERAEAMNVFSVEMPVMALEDVLTSKLLALNEHELDFEPLLRVARPLRERIRWSDVAMRTRRSPYARAFFKLLEELEILPAGGSAAASGDGPSISVKPVSEALP
jgi:hypothetical protein